MKTQLEILQERFINAQNDIDRDAVQTEIAALCEKDAQAVAEAALEMIRETNKEASEMALREQLKEILPAISLAYIAKTYFNKTRQWLYQRINGSIVNGKMARFTPEEAQILNDALKKIGNKLSSINVSA